MAKICRRCKLQYNDNAQICGKCGSPLESVGNNQKPVQSAAAAQRHVNSINQTDANQIAKKTPNTKKIIIVAIAVVLVVAIVVCGVIFIPDLIENKNGEKTEKANSSFISPEDSDKNNSQEEIEPNMIPADYKFTGKTISADERHTVAIKNDGTVVATEAWFYGISDIPNLRNIVEIDTGCWHTVCLKYDGTVVAVGNNEKGQSNVSDWSGIVSVSAEDWHTFGLKADGTVVATQGVGEFEYMTRDVSSWTDIVAISSGATHTVGLKADGTVVAVGDEDYGACDVDDWSDIVSVACGRFCTIGLKSDGTVVSTEIGYERPVSFGSTYTYIDERNDYGQTDVSGWTDIVAISAGKYHTVGLKSDGTVVATPFDDRYTPYNREPYNTDDFYSGQCEVSEWTDIVAVSAGDYYTIGLKSDGTVVSTDPSGYFDGLNDDGQALVGHFTDIAIPQNN